MSYSIQAKGREIKTWHVNNRKPVLHSEIEWIMVDGDELEQIKKRFQNLPIAHRICTWRGEMAQFIYDNI